MATQPHSANGPVFVSVAFEADELQLVQQAALLQGATVQEFAHQAAMLIAMQQDLPNANRTSEEVWADIREAQRLMREANPDGHDLVAELIAERRAEAARE